LPDPHLLALTFSFPEALCTTIKKVSDSEFKNFEN